MKSNTKSLEKQAEEILKRAEEKGVQQNFFFATTFKRYLTQLKIMSELEKEIEEIGATVKKEYVKGRSNVYTNPAITEYNKTATAANGTVGTLINIIKSMGADEKTTGSKLDSLVDLVNNG